LSDKSLGSVTIITEGKVLSPKPITPEMSVGDTIDWLRMQSKIARAKAEVYRKEDENELRNYCIGESTAFQLVAKKLGCNASWTRK